MAIKRTPHSKLSIYELRMLNALKQRYSHVKFTPVTIVEADRTMQTIRPYAPGMGCDGTTTGNVHLIAQTLVERLGGNYQDIQSLVYPNEKPIPRSVLKRFRGGTYIPNHIVPEIVVEDLHEINYHSLAEYLRKWFSKKLGRNIRPDNVSTVKDLLGE